MIVARAPGPGGRLLGATFERFLRWPWALVLLAAAAASLFGAIAQWGYIELGIDLEALVIGRLSGRPVAISLPATVVAALGAGTLGVLASGLVGHGVLRLLRSTSRPLATTVRATAFASLGALGKLVPGIGYFCALAAVLVLSIWALHRAHAITRTRAAVAVLATTAAVVVLAALAATMRPPDP
jgi:hypothetical protein